MNHFEGPLIVVGIGRSGTSLVQSMLASHSKISFPPETAFFRRYVATGKLADAYTMSGKNGLKRLLRNDEGLIRTKLDIDRLVDDVLGNNKPHLGAALYYQILSAYATRASKPIVGDKDPKLIEHLKSLHRYWPNAKILHIFRDPRDVLASKKRAAWSRNRHPFGHILANNIQWRLGRKYGPNLFGKNYRLLQYERLLSAPKQELNAVCNWLGVNFEETMMSPGEAAKQLVTEEELQWKKETLGPLLTKNTGKWANELSPIETALVEKANNDVMNAGHYRLAAMNSSQPYFWKLFLNVLSSLVNGAAYTYVLFRQ